VRAAFQNGSLSFGFSAGGLMFPYYVGVVSALEQMGLAHRDTTKLAGASAGSLIAAAFNAGVSIPALEESMALFGEDCLRNGTRGRLGPLLRDFLHAYLPPDAAERCRGRTHVAVTHAVPYFRPSLVSTFRGRDDLIEALLASCHIPWYFDGRWLTRFRGRFAVDGGATNFVRVLFVWLGGGKEGEKRGVGGERLTPSRIHTHFECITHQASFSILKTAPVFYQKTKQIPVVPGAEYTAKVMCFPTSHLEALRARAGGHALAERYLGVDVSLDAYEHWPHGLPMVRGGLTVMLGVGQAVCCAV
jgi:hypothetical protein